MSPIDSPLRYHATHRTATWLELFYDLIFVVVVSKVTHLLAHTHHGHLDEGVWWKFPLMLLPVWWIWLIHTVWANLYDSDGKHHRVVSLFVMLQMVVWSTVMITDWGKAYPLYNGCYLALRLTLSGMYFFCSGSHDGYKRFGRECGVVLLVGALVSASSMFFDEPVRYGVFYLGLAIDMAHPLLLKVRGLTPPMHSHHLIERMGLLIIILIGESVIMLSAGLVDMHWDGQTIMAAVSGALLIGATWWIYFDSYHLLGRDNGRVADGLALTYPHFLTCMGLAITANVIHHAIHPGIDRLEYQLMAGAGVVVFYVGKQVPYYMKYTFVRRYVYINTGLTFVFACGALCLPSNASILLGLTVALVFYITINYFTTIRKMRETFGD